MSNNPTTEDFPYRVIAFLGGVMAVGTPLVRWVAKYLRDARIQEFKAWIRTDDGRDCMTAVFQETLERDQRYMYDYLNDWKEKNCR